jgi:hypothetical protein
LTTRSIAQKRAKMPPTPTMIATSTINARLASLSRRKSSVHDITR